MVGLIGVVATLVPARYRPRVLGDANVSMKRSAIVSGAGQMVLCCALIWARYPAFIQARLQQGAEAVARAGGDQGAVVASDYALGVMGPFEYIIQPLTLLFFYFALEGAVRLVGAVATSEVLPTLPLQLVAWAGAAITARQRERALGPRVADVVDAGEELRVASCRPKEWTALSTIRFQDQLYEVAKREVAQPPRPFVYLLRRIPPGKVIRGLHDYDPNDVLQNK